MNNTSEKSDVNSEHMDDKLKFYNDRYAYWTDIALSQLSFTNNLLLTISLGFLGFCFNNETADSLWKTLSIITIGISILLGLCIVFCRLYDFRISRRLLLIRKRVYEKKKIKLPEESLGKFKMRHRLGAFLNVLFTALPEVTNEEIEEYDKNEEKIDTNFVKLRILSKKLGSASWTWTKTQVLFFLLSITSYIINHIKS